MGRLLQFEMPRSIGKARLLGFSLHGCLRHLAGADAERGHRGALQSVCLPNRQVPQQKLPLNPGNKQRSQAVDTRTRTRERTPGQNENRESCRMWNFRSMVLRQFVEHFTASFVDVLATIGMFSYLAFSFLPEWETTVETAWDDASGCEIFWDYKATLHCAPCTAPSAAKAAFANCLAVRWVFVLMPYLVVGKKSAALWTRELVSVCS